MNCVRCGKIINMNIPEDEWIRAKKEESIKHLPHDAQLMFLVNSGYNSNIWLCNDCFKIWTRFFHSKDDTEKPFTFSEGWKIFSEGFRLVRVKVSFS